MKKVLLKKLQSLTAILVLNTVPVSFAQASNISYEAEVLQARVLVDDKRNALKSVHYQKDTLKQLYFDNSLTYIQKHSKKAATYQHQVALALVEEAYQDDYDTLLDQYELELENVTDANGRMTAKNRVKEQLQDLKVMRGTKIAEFDRQFGIT
ncbi:hypothetical protein [Marinomonas foliarum]|uniref:Uncharacterized protein n=1 Tax=Marinomonas foliarum TaxID=491950 RepID=A0A368ZTY3_9GAMM|nr:hypothetical protein [Marinomonas foliarum]QRV24150.1 hypothetical protein JSY38_01000 [Marinomonas foliarum]RCX00435.1 hypothetical protein DFP77_12212 [Marinomonas foliarum]